MNFTAQLLIDMEKMDESSMEIREQSGEERQNARGVVHRDKIGGKERVRVVGLRDFLLRTSVVAIATLSGTISLHLCHTTVLCGNHGHKRERYYL